MKTKIVTAFYTDVGGHPFYGHFVIARHDRYMHSLRVLSNTNEEIVCYCNESQLALLQEHCNNFNLSNVTLKVSNLTEFPYAKKMEDIKNQTNSYKFYHEIDWNKFYLLEKEYSEEYDYIYWVDVGISHRGLFLLKYNPNSSYITGMSNNFADYSFTGLFKPGLFDKINEWVGDKLINLANTCISHRKDEINSVYDIDYILTYMSVGGIIGGHCSKLRFLLDTFTDKGLISLNKNVILNHEQIMTLIEKENPQKYKTYKFDTWYHDDYWKTTPDFDNSIIENNTHFVHFFEKELNL
jgi:hypothetical protein